MHWIIFYQIVLVSVLGQVKGNALKINENEFSIKELKDSYYGVIEKYMA